MLKIENIKKSYKGFQLDLSMEIENGSIVGLVGANGAGKSTLFKTILGIVHKESGKIYLNDKDITNLRTKDKELISSYHFRNLFSGYYIKSLSWLIKNE